MACYNDNVLFIHIPKTAGLSVKRYMDKCLEGVLLPDNPAAKLPIGHVRLQDIERFTGRAPDSFKTIITVIRDPYAQQLSQWMFWRDRFARGDNNIHDIVAGHHGRLVDWLQDGRCDFHVWYEQHVGYQPGMNRLDQQLAAEVRENGVLPVRYPDAGGYYKYWLTVDGEIPDNVNILKTETLDTTLPEELSYFVDPTWHATSETRSADDALGEQRAIRNSMPEVTHYNTANFRGDPRHYYTPTAAKIVESKFAWAFEHYYPRWMFSEMER